VSPEVATAPIATGNSDAAIDAAEEPETRDQILAAAFRSVITYGPARVSMSEIAKEAGLSRGTVYRYFTDRGELLEAMNDFVEQTFLRELDRTVEARPPGTDRVRAVIDFLVEYGARSETQRVQQNHPQFALDFLRRNFGAHLAAVTTQIENEPDCENMARRGVSPAALAEIILRTATANAFLEQPDTGDVRHHLNELWHALTG
jgi:AcrR family transcriptional regulator